MDTEIVAVFCLCDDMIKVLAPLPGSPKPMSDAEVMTTTKIEGVLFRGNY